MKSDSGLLTIWPRSWTLPRHESRPRLRRVPKPLTLDTVHEEIASPRRLSTPTLDLQACRDFIVLQLGELEQIPCISPYEEGISQIRSRLISKFGIWNIDCLMRILDDLIENKDNANGFGDDGDRWATW